MSRNTNEKTVQMTVNERLSAQIVELRSRAKLDTWNQFATEMQVPADLYPAIMVNRPQLIPKGRALTADECQILYNLIGVLMETNSALREHTEQVAKLTDKFMDQFKGISAVASQINMFANMRVGEED